MNRPPLLLTDDEAPAYLLTRVTRSDAEADQAQRQERELDGIQKYRHQKKPRKGNWHRKSSPN